MSLIRFATRSLAVLHVLAGTLLIHSSLFILGFISGLLIVGPIGVWLIILGTKLWRLEQGTYKSVLVTHTLLLIFSAALIRLGLWMLHRAELSAQQGGGLLGGVGFIPIFAGCGLVVLSILSIVTLLLVKRAQSQ